MFPLLNIFLEYYLPVSSGIIAGLLCKAYFNIRTQNKLKNYKDDIRECNKKIVEMEASNEKLKTRIKDMEAHPLKEYFSKN